MAKCGDCLYFGFCKKYIDPEETFPEIEGGCYVFEKKADYVKVVHGKWLPQKLLGERVWDCSECKTLGSPQWKFCPVCGATMDGGNEDVQITY